MIRFPTLLSALLPLVLGLVASANQAWAEEIGYPPPPGTYHSGPLAEPAPDAQTLTTDQAKRGRAGRLPLLDGFDTYPANDTANLLFGSAPPPPSAATPDQPDMPDYPVYDRPATPTAGYTGYADPGQHYLPGRTDPGDPGPGYPAADPNQPPTATLYLPEEYPADDDAAGIAIFRPAE